eukprot:89711_1
MGNCNCMSSLPKEQGYPNTNKKINTSKKQTNNAQSKASSIEARNAAAAAAQDRMRALTKSPDNPTNIKLTKQKKKMVHALDDIDNRQKEMEQIKQDRIDRGLSVE